MQPIAIDTILQQRYRVLKSIGEGGFGRTYLATDQSRFGEQCAVKELCMSARSRSRLSKAREFFQQEAALLYQLQHPQIPRFWATFEERDRMFLVQDFVPGRTYEQLLGDRANQNQAFTEAEVWRFLLQVLPVLGYIHSQGVVHQDIAPDNIILRENDLLPVLIDFGVVKQLANRLQGEQTALSTVNVGKPGYAPVEQLGSGYAYPNSDLYALAVTALVLLTGRPAVDLFEGERVNWAWRNWVSISDGLANVLGKMLSYQPLDRYQSAVEVFQALQSISIPADRGEPFKPISISKIHGAADSPVDASRISNPVDNEYVRNPTTVRKVYTALTQFDVRSAWEKPQVVIPLFLGVAVLSFAASMALTSVLKKAEEPIVAATPPATTQQPLVSSRSGRDNNGNKSIDLVAGQTVIQRGQLPGTQEISYEFYGTQGQEITFSIDNRSLLLTVSNPNGLPVDTEAIRTPSWRGKILVTGKHAVTLKALPGAKGDAFDYRLSGSLALNSNASNPASTAAPPLDNRPPQSPIIGNPTNDIPNIVPPGAIPRPVPISVPSSQPRAFEKEPEAVPNEKTSEKPAEKPVESTPSPQSPSPTSRPTESSTPSAEPSQSPSPVQTSPSP
jgi:serine/threonine protein kinase